MPAKNIRKFPVFSILATAAALALIIAAAIGAQKLFEPKEAVVLSAEEIRNISPGEALPTEDQSALIEAALSLVGKVGYFWGGKSDAIGWDDRWGVPTRVDSSGSDTTGTLRPFGMDCSGYVSWCFRQLGYSAVDVDGLIGSGTWNQWDKSTPIAWRELRAGDFVFQNKYPGADSNHIGICVGFTQDGEPVFAHCSASEDNVVVTTAGDIFKYARRPSVFTDIENVSIVD